MKTSEYSKNIIANIEANLAKCKTQQERDELLYHWSLWLLRRTSYLDRMFGKACRFIVEQSEVELEK